MAIADLLARWAARAEELGPYAAPAAEAFRCAVRELEVELAGRSSTAVSPTDAAKVTHYHAESITRLIRTGKVTNYGTKRRPLVKLEELPHKSAPTPRPRPQVANRSKGPASSGLSIARDAVAGRIGRR